MFHANAWGLAHAAVACGADLVMPGADLSGKALADLIVERAGHDRRRRADDLDAGAARAAGPRHVEPAGDPVRRLGGVEGAVGVVPRAARPADPAGVGDDRDEPGGHRGPPRRRPGAAVRRRAGRAAHRRSAAPSWASTAASSSRARPRRCRATASRAASCSAAGRGSRPATTTTTAARRELHRRRLAAHRRRGDDGRARADQARRPHQGPDQVRRRVDLVGRDRERADGATRRSARPPSSASRTSAGASARWPASCSSRGQRADRSRTCSSSSRRRLAKWQLPDHVVFIDEVPKTSVGKFSKKTLRDRFPTMPREFRVESRASLELVAPACGRRRSIAARAPAGPLPPRPPPVRRYRQACLHVPHAPPGPERSSRAPARSR